LIALLASVLVVAYIVVPGVIFRVVFSFFVPLRAFDRTRTQEFSYSVVVCIVPLALAIAIVRHTPFGRHPFSFDDTWAQRGSDYRTILLTSYSDHFAASREEFWAAITRATKRQARLLSWHFALVSLEALSLGFLATKWGHVQPKLAAWPRADGLATRLLLRNISEWHVLLTNFLFPGTTIQADVLTTEDRLYRGEVLTYQLDRDGKLTGIYLNHAERYDRTGLLSDRKGGVSKPTADYWKRIPGRRLFIFADRLFTLNLRPQTTLAAAERLVLQLDPKARVSVERASGSPPDTPEPDDPGAMTGVKG
jgi:hypothetical protein